MLVRDRIAEVAALIAATKGFEVTRYINWESSEHPRVRGCWNAALLIWEVVTGDTPDLDADIE